MLLEFRLLVFRLFGWLTDSNLVRVNADITTRWGGEQVEADLTSSKGNCQKFTTPFSCEFKSPMAN